MIKVDHEVEHGLDSEFRVFNNTITVTVTRLLEWQ